MKKTLKVMQQARQHASEMYTIALERENRMREKFARKHGIKKEEK